LSLDRAAFIKAHTQLAEVPLVPAIKLHLADEATLLWQQIEDDLGVKNLPPPYWAFAWAGGQAVARYLLDNPHIVQGKNVLDFASGSGLIAIAAAKAGAVRVAANDIDPFAFETIQLNAIANDVSITILAEDILAETSRAHETFDVILAGDVSYERDMAERVTAWLASRAKEGKTVLVGDPGRAYLARESLEPVASYDVPVSFSLENCEQRTAAVYRFKSV